MPVQNNFKEVLSQEGLKNTKHRNAILGILENSETPLSAEEIFLKLKTENAAICLSTIYRTLEMLKEKDLINKSNFLDDHKSSFEMNRNEHKHHAVCLSCHKVISIEECPFGEIEDSLRKSIGFSVTGHKLEIYGYCSDCNKIDN